MKNHENQSQRKYLTVNKKNKKKSVFKLKNEDKWRKIIE